MTIEAWQRSRSDEERTLASVQRLHDYPFYVMNYYGPTPPLWIRRATAGSAEPLRERAPRYACSVFACRDRDGRPIVGRNFDYPYAPVLALHTDPPDSYSSVSFVDTLDLGLTADDFVKLDEPESRKALLSTPLLPLDGMNDQGLVVTMAAVPDWDLIHKPGSSFTTSVAVLRALLDHARDVDEALTILGHYNIDPLDEPPIHYLIADRSGDAVVVELLTGEMRLIGRQDPWQLMVNFNLSEATDETRVNDWRWCEASRRLSELDGRADIAQAFEVLSAVQQEDTQWSTVYEPTAGVVHLALGHNYEAIRLLGVRPD